MIPRIDIIIDEVREVNAETEAGEGEGVSQETFLIAAQNAIKGIQRILVKEAVRVFAEFEDYDEVASQEVYNLPDDIFATSLVYEVQYSETDETRLFPLKLSQNRRNEEVGTPEYVYLAGKKFYLYPVRASGGGLIRLSYEKRLPTFSLRRAQVTAITVASTTLSAITAVAEEDELGSDNEGKLGRAEYICLVDNYGTFTAQNVKITAWDSNTGVFTLPSSHTLETGQVPAIGDWVCIGRDATTHIDLDPVVYDYILERMKIQLFETTSSLDNETAIPTLSDLIRDMIEVYSQLPQMKTPIPENREEYC